MLQSGIFFNENIVLPEPYVPTPVQDVFIHQTAINDEYGKIDLGYIPVPGTSVRITFKWLESSASAAGDNYAFGCNERGELYSPSLAYGMRIRTNYPERGFYCEPSFYDWFTDSPANANFSQYSDDVHTVEFRYDLDTAEFKFIFDGVDAVTRTMGAPVGVERTLWIFSCNTPWPKPSSREFAVSRVEIFEGDELVADYRGRLTTYSGEGYHDYETGALYETISGTYYYPTYLNSNEFYPFMEDVQNIDY